MVESPRNFRYTQEENYRISFFWEDPVLPNVIQLTGYVLFYNVTDAFNQKLSDSIHISPDDNSYAFNKMCSYETGLSLCPSSQYCFVLRGAYNRNGVASLTIPSDRICLTTPEYRKNIGISYLLLIYNFYCSIIYIISGNELQHYRGNQTKY